MKSNPSSRPTQLSKPSATRSPIRKNPNWKQPTSRNPRADKGVTVGKRSPSSERAPRAQSPIQTADRRSVSSERAQRGQSPIQPVGFAKKTPSDRPSRSFTGRTSGPVKFIPKTVIDDDRRVYGIHAVMATLEHMPSRAKKLYYIEKTSRNEPIIALAQEAGIIIEQTTRQVFDTNYGTDIVHQGVMLMTAPFPYVDLDEALAKGTKIVVVLDSIEDPRNLGRAARSAFALGADILVIPTNRAAGITASVEKAAVGTLARIPVAQVTNLNQTLEKLKKAGLWVVGSAGDTETPLWGSDLSRPTAIVIGSEESGLRKLVRENCDELVRIPMNAKDMSLNAADALTIMLYEVQRQMACATEA